MSVVADSLVTDAPGVWRDRPALRWLGHSGRVVLRAYSQIVFSRSPAIGALLLLATLAWPQVGLAGLAAVVLGAAVGATLRIDASLLAEGIYGYNPLLVGLLVGSTVEGPALWLILVVAVPLTVLAQLGLAAAMATVRLPVLSLPFVAVGWLLQGVLPYLFAAPKPAAPAWTGVAFSGSVFLDSVGALFFTGWLAGAVILVSLALWSRLATLYTLVGLAAAWGLTLVLDVPTAVLVGVMGFNAFLTAIAAGGVYWVPSRQSLLLAAFGAVLASVLTLALHHLLQPVSLPVFTLPFNLVVLGLLLAMAQRGAGALPAAVDVPRDTPEETLHHFRTRVQRFYRSLPVYLQLPFRGEWVVTQGNDGEHTHRGAWRHGLDFEVADRTEQRHRGSGARLEDWLCYRLPVVAPAAATVVAVVDGLPDNPPGELDTAHPWGNLVVLHLAPGLYAVLAHLSPGSLEVAVGDRVVSGQELGRCGSSGRAPTPHLHVQLQRTPVVGDPTVPVAFHGVVDGEGTLHRELLPVEGARVRNPVRSPRVASVVPPIGARWTATVDGEDPVELTSEIDLLGARSLASADGDRLWFADYGTALVVFDAAARSDALVSLYAALPRLPLDEEPMTWEDDLNPRRLSRSSLLWILDLAAAVAPVGPQRARYAATREGEILEVRGHADARYPWETEVHTLAVLRRGQLVETRLTRGEREVRVQWETS